MGNLPDYISLYSLVDYSHGRLLPGHQLSLGKQLQKPIATSFEGKHTSLHRLAGKPFELLPLRKLRTTLNGSLLPKPHCGPPHTVLLHIQALQTTLPPRLADNISTVMQMCRSLLPNSSAGELFGNKLVHDTLELCVSRLRHIGAIFGHIQVKGV